MTSFPCLPLPIHVCTCMYASARAFARVRAREHERAAVRCVHPAPTPKRARARDTAQVDTLSVIHSAFVAVGKVQLAMRDCSHVEPWLIVNSRAATPAEASSRLSAVEGVSADGSTIYDFDGQRLAVKRSEFQHLLQDLQYYFELFAIFQESSP